jgi:hypothetical protein
MTKYKFNKQKISILICMFFSCLTDSFSQSKKEQIELLTLKYDSLSIVSLEERTRFIKEIEKLNIVNENIILEKDSFRLKNDELNKQIVLYKSQIEMLDSKINKLSDSISKYSTFEILSFFIQEEIEIIAGPVMQVDYAVLQISDKTIKGFVGWASQGDSEYYISGNLVNGTYIGDVYCVGSVENCASLKGKFQLKIENMNLKLSGEARVDHDEIPIYNGKHFFHGGALTDLLIEPKIGSKILKPNIIDLGAEILAIGNYEKINDTYNLWYKVKINDVIGWVFGGLCTVCPESNN